MKEKIYRLLPFDVTEYDHMEAWLEDMAAKGWLLTDEILPMLAQFEKSEPKQRRYRIIPVTDRIADGAAQDEIALYETYGWQRVYQRRGMEIFYTDYPNAEELFTDSESFRLRARRHLLGHSFMILLLLWMLLWVLVSSARVADAMRFEPLHLLHLTGETLALGLLCCTILAVVSACVSLVRYGRFLQRMKTNAAPEPSADYKPALRRNRARMLASFLSVLLLLIGILVSHNFPYTSVPAEKIGTFELSHPMSVADWSPTLWARIEPCLRTGSWTVGVSYSEDRYHDVLFSDIQTVNAEAAGERYYASWYEARTESIAARFLAEELPEDAAQFQLDGADYAGIAWGTLYLRSGNRLMIVTAEGGRNLKTAAPELLRNLEAS